MFYWSFTDHLSIFGQPQFLTLATPVEIISTRYSSVFKFSSALCARVCSGAQVPCGL